MRTGIQAIDNELLRDLPTNSEDLEPQQTLKITGVDSIQKITKYLECVHCSKGIIQGTCTDINICEHWLHDEDRLLPDKSCGEDSH